MAEGIRELLQRHGLPGLAHRSEVQHAETPRDQHKQEVYKRVEEYTMQYDKYTLTKELGAKGVPVGPVLHWNELENDPDLNEDGTLITIDQGDALRQVQDDRPAVHDEQRCAGSPARAEAGENNEEILSPRLHRRADRRSGDQGRHRLERWRQGRPHRRSGTGPIALHRSHAGDATRAGFEFNAVSKPALRILHYKPAGSPNSGTGRLHTRGDSRN